MLDLNDNRDWWTLDDPDDESVDARSQRAGYYWRSSTVAQVDPWSSASLRSWRCAIMQQARQSSQEIKLLPFARASILELARLEWPLLPMSPPIKGVTVHGRIPSRGL